MGLNQLCIGCRNSQRPCTCPISASYLLIFTLLVVRIACDDSICFSSPVSTIVARIIHVHVHDQFVYMSTLVASSLISTLVARMFHVGSCSCSLNLLNAIPLHIHAIILIQIVCSFTYFVIRILHVHVHVKFNFIFTHFHVFMFKFKFIFIQTKMIFSCQSPRHQVHVISVTQICQSFPQQLHL